MKKKKKLIGIKCYKLIYKLFFYLRGHQCSRLWQWEEWATTERFGNECELIVYIEAVYDNFYFVNFLVIKKLIFIGKLFANDGTTKRAQTFGELHEKLNELKGQKKLSYKQKQLKKGLKNRIKKKTKREVRLMQKKNIKKDDGEEEDSISSIKKNDELPKVSRAKPVFNSEGNMVFSKFDFSDIGTKKKSTKMSSDPKKILQHLKDQKEELKTLVDSGDKEKAQEIQQKEMWKNVLAKANGIKVNYLIIYIKFLWLMKVGDDILFYVYDSPR